MIAELKPYSTYQPSDLKWLGEVPEHWELRRMKTLLLQRSEKGFPDEPLLAATQTKGVVRKEHYENRTVLAMKDLHLLKIVRLGDFVISLRSFQGGIEYAREQGIISPAYTILYPADTDNHAYLARVFKSKTFIDNLSLFVTGIRQGQNIDYDKLARSRLPLPPLPEQTAITHFLDYTDRRIQRYIRAKQKLITLLEEQKQAIIHQAVTGQIDVRTGQPYPAYKDSGVEWLGEVPEHWGVWKVGHFSKVGNGSTPSRSNAAYWSDGTYPWLNSSSVNQGIITRADQFVTDLALRECHLPWVLPGSVVVGITGQGKTRGMAALLAIEATINQNMAYIMPSTARASSHYLHMYLTAAYSELRAISDDSGRTEGALTCEVIKRFKVALPPLPEQTAIVYFLDHATTDIDQAISHTQRQIDLLGEYRTRLISDVVTGKLDVREAAAALPDIDPLEAEADLETLEPTTELTEEFEAIAEGASA